MYVPDIVYTRCKDRAISGLQCSAEVVCGDQGAERAQTMLGRVFITRKPSARIINDFDGVVTS